MAVKASTAPTKQTRQRKKILQASELTAEQFETLKVASEALAGFVGMHAFLAKAENPPNDVVKLRDGYWSTFFKKVKSSGIFKNKRKPRTPEQEKFDERKGELLQALKKARKNHGEDSKEAKAAHVAFKAHAESRKKK